MKAVLFGLCAALSLALGAHASDSPTHEGDAQSFGNGTVRPYVQLDAEGKPLVIGIRMTASALEGLPEVPNTTSRCFDNNGNGRIDEHGECEGDTEVRMSIPSEFAQDPANPFRFIAINYNPHGHPPQAWSVPHFDFHFYMVDRQEIDAIREGPCQFFINCEDRDRALREVPARYVAEGHVSVGAAVSRMGNHLIDSRTPELAEGGPPFTHTWIYGAYDGHITFYEPMATRAFLLTRPDVCTPMRQPATWEKSGYYPTTYCIRYLGASAEYTISLEDFVHRNGE